MPDLGASCFESPALVDPLKSPQRLVTRDRPRLETFLLAETKGGSAGETDEGEKDRATTRATAREMDFTSPNGLAPRAMPMTRCWQFLCCHFLAPRSRASCEQHINSLASQHLSLQVLARE